MAFIRFLIGLFYKEENKLEKNLEEWNSYFEKGKLVLNAISGNFNNISGIDFRVGIDVASGQQLENAGVKIDHINILRKQKMKS